MAIRANADPYAAYPVIPNPDRSQWNKREDGSNKADGWLGVRKRPDGNVSSEISVEGEVAGKDGVSFPLMVPGLTSDEMKYLMTHEPDQEKNPNFIKDMPKSILQKASAFAQKRIARGKSPFRQRGESANPDD